MSRSVVSAGRLFHNAGVSTKNAHFVI